MLDKREISNKHKNEVRKSEALDDRSLKNYSDETIFGILGFGKLIYHPEKLVGIKNDKNVFPLTATLSLGNYCNHGCLWCSTAYHREEDSKSINAKLILKWLKKAKKKGLVGVGYVGNGEPLAYKKFSELSSEICKIGLDQGIFTNGFLINRYEQQLIENFTYIRISLDAGTKKTHAKLHAVDESHFTKIIENLKKIILKRNNKTPTIGVQFATHQQNIFEIKECVKICKDIGVDYLSIKPVFDRGVVRDKIEKNNLKKENYDKVFDSVRQHETKDFKIYYRPQQVISNNKDQNMLVYNRCYAGLFGVNIYEDGLITGCGPHHLAVGNLKTPFKELEKNILKLSKELDLVKCPSGCRYHPLNFLLHKIINKEEFSKSDHLNLI